MSWSYIHWKLIKFIWPKLFENDNMNLFDIPWVSRILFLKKMTKFLFQTLAVRTFLSHDPMYIRGWTCISTNNMNPGIIVIAPGNINPIYRAQKKWGLEPKGTFSIIIVQLYFTMQRRGNLNNNRY